MIVDNSAWNIYNFRMPLVRKLSQLHKDIFVVSPIDEYIHYLNETNFIKHIPCNHLMPRSRNPFRDLLLIAELFIIYLRVKPDLILHFTIKPNTFGNIVARMLGIPTISVVTGLGFTFLNPKGINRFIPSLYRFAFQKIKKLVLYNADDKEVFISQKIVPPSKCMIVPGSGVNTQHFQPRVNEQNSGNFIFLFIGRLLKDKGLVEYVEASRRIRESHPNAECWVVGDFHDVNPAAVPKETLLEWVENKDIHYLGKVMDVREVISKAHVLVLPSYREGVPRVVLEAMSMGKPVVTTDAAGCRETVVHGKNGFIVPIKNPGALALAMTTLIEAPQQELDNMGKNSRQRAMTFFDEKIIVDTYVKLLQQLFPSSFHAPPAKSRTKVFR